MWNDREVKILKNNYSKMYVEDLMALLPNRTLNAIFLKANKLGLKREMRDSKNSRKYVFDYNYFENIDTANKAYYLGWALTDGNVSDTQYRIRLQSKDIDILEKFSKDIKSTYPIYNRDNGKSKELVLSHRKIVDDLYKLGCCPHKTFIIEVPKINKIYEWDFIKGVFDGDGCYICTDKTKKISLVSGSKVFINQLSNILKKYNIKSTIYKPKDYNCYRLEITSKKGIKLFVANILNTKSDFLDRKYNKIIKLKEYINS